MSLRAAARRLQVAHSLFVKWEGMRANEGDPILLMLKTGKKSTHPGPIGQLKTLEYALLRYIFEQREQGIVVQTFDLVVKASSLSQEFGVKQLVARMSAVN